MLWMDLRITWIVVGSFRIIQSNGFGEPVDFAASSVAVKQDRGPCQLNCEKASVRSGSTIIEYDRMYIDESLTAFQRKEPPLQHNQHSDLLPH